ncbi:hypothetical protein AB0L00_17040 [Actinoallomurus sp. NPDC052308]|uniref:hypothetical protein n=1 Tax=Actinoallomurus sp. NPDC052308 TaxID=3155530 RepID=UPI0034367BEC
MAGDLGREVLRQRLQFAPGRRVELGAGDVLGNGRAGVTARPWSGRGPIVPSGSARAPLGGPAAALGVVAPPEATLLAFTTAAARTAALPVTEVTTAFVTALEPARALLAGLETLRAALAGPEALLTLLPGSEAFLVARPVSPGATTRPVIPARATTRPIVPTRAATRPIVPAEAFLVARPVPAGATTRPIVPTRAPARPVIPPEALLVARPVPAGATPRPVIPTRAATRSIVSAGSAAGARTALGAFLARETAAAAGTALVSPTRGARAAGPAVPGTEVAVLPTLVPLTFTPRRAIAGTLRRTPFLVAPVGRAAALSAAVATPVSGRGRTAATRPGSATSAGVVSPWEPASSARAFGVVGAEGPRTTNLRTPLGLIVPRVGETARALSTARFLEPAGSTGTGAIARRSGTLTAVSAGGVVTPPPVSPAVGEATGRFRGTPLTTARSARRTARAVLASRPWTPIAPVAVALISFRAHHIKPFHWGSTVDSIVP